MNKVILC